jgi:hypothetical protein
MGLASAWSGRGADITYHFSDKNTLIVEVNIYSNCIDSAPADNDIEFGVFSGNSGIECGKYSLNNFKLKEVQYGKSGCSDPEQICKSNTNFPHTERLETFKYHCTLTVNEEPMRTLLAKDCEWINFYVKAGIRPFWLTTMQGSSNLYVVAGLNIKNLKKLGQDERNNGIVWLSEPQNTLLLNSRNILNPFASDTLDNDKVTIGLAPAISVLYDPQGLYFSPFTPQYPISPYCITPGKLDCAAFPDATRPRGIFMDSLSGNLIFTPVKADERGSIVFKAIERRLNKDGEWMTLGFSSREVIYTVADPGFNKAPAITYSSRRIQVQPGDTIRETFTIQDEQLKPYQLNPDSLTFRVVHTPPGSSVNMIKDSGNLKKFEILWVTDSTHLRTYPYLFYFMASDQHCPFSGMLHFGFSMQVGPENNMTVGNNVRHTDSQNTLVINSELVVMNPDISEVELSIFNSKGQHLLTLNNNSGIRNTQLNQGVYFYEVVCKKQNSPCFYRGKFCKL